MGYRAAEEVTLPLRFLTLSAHFVAVLTIIFDVRTLAAQILLNDSNQAVLYSEEHFSQLSRRLSSAAYAAIACFAVEYITLFLGVSLFMRCQSCLYIILHFSGAVVTGLLYTQAWSVGALAAFVVVFNALPAALELLTFLFVARVSYFAY